MRRSASPWYVSDQGKRGVTASATAHILPFDGLSRARDGGAGADLEPQPLAIPRQGRGRPPPQGTGAARRERRPRTSPGFGPRSRRHGPRTVPSPSPSPSPAGGGSRITAGRLSGEVSSGSCAGTIRFGGNEPLRVRAQPGGRGLRGPSGMEDDPAERVTLLEFAAGLLLLCQRVALGNRHLGATFGDQPGLPISSFLRTAGATWERQGLVPPPALGPHSGSPGSPSVGQRANGWSRPKKAPALRRSYTCGRLWASLPLVPTSHVAGSAPPPWPKR